MAEEWARTGADANGSPAGRSEGAAVNKERGNRVLPRPGTALSAVYGVVLALSSASSGAMERIIALLDPTVLLLDDMDRTGSAEGLLAFMADRHSASIVVGTVNALGQLDPALLRPGRFDEVVSVDAPTGAWARAVVDHYAAMFDVPVSAADGVLFDGLTPAEVREVLMVCGTVGADLLEGEIARVRAQSEHYSGDAVQRHLKEYRR